MSADKALAVYATAPGKVILFGEHACVYGHSAIAACVSDLRTSCRAERAVGRGLSVTLEGGLSPKDQAQVKALESGISAGRRVGWALDALAPLVNKVQDAMREQGWTKSWQTVRDAGATAFDPSDLLNDGVRAELSRLSSGAGAAAAAAAERDSGREGDKGDGFYALEPAFSPPVCKALNALLFLAAALYFAPRRVDAGEGDAQGLHIHVKSIGLPVGAGLGSSAALGVSVAGALLGLSRLSAGLALGCGEEQEEEEEEGGGGGGGGEGSDRVGGCDSGGGRSGNGAVAGATTLGAAATTATATAAAATTQKRPRPPLAQTVARANAWAFASEKLLHGSPSGIDNATSCFGGAVKLFRGAGSDRNETKPLPGGMPGIRFLITDTRVPRETSALVAGVRSLLDRRPKATEAALRGMGAVAEEFESALAAAVSGADAGETTATTTSAAAAAAATATMTNATLCKEMAELMRMNQGLLAAVGVSHPAIEDVVARAREKNFASKLTGAGGGGCVVTLVEGSTKAEAAALAEALTKRGYRCFETRVGGRGLLLQRG